jgi:hypothetical protein
MCYHGNKVDSSDFRNSGIGLWKWQHNDLPAKNGNAQPQAVQIICARFSFIPSIVTHSHYLGTLGLAYSISTELLQ